MAVELFATAVTRPEAVFCDTSFLLDLLTHEVASVGQSINLTPDKVKRAAQAAAFFNTYFGGGTRFVSTPYAFQELAQVLGKGVLKTGAPKTNRWKDLEQASANQFQQLHGVWMSVVQDAWARIQSHGIWFIVPSTSGAETKFGREISPEVVEAAQLLMVNYPLLDPADTYHIAMGIACGVEWFATVDEPWKLVSEINLFCYR